MKYLALLRGINVGGKNKVSMSEVRDCLESRGMQNVSTYINSGNIIFSSKINDAYKLRLCIEEALGQVFGLEITVVVIEASRYIHAIQQAPSWWGRDHDWKHNAIFIIEPQTTAEVLGAIGDLRPNIEAVQAGDGVIFQSLEFSKFGQTTTGKIAGSPIYKYLTIRNYNTTRKLALLLG